MDRCTATLGHNSCKVGFPGVMVSILVSTASAAAYWSCSMSFVACGNPSSWTQRRFALWFHAQPPKPPARPRTSKIQTTNTGFLNAALSTFTTLTTGRAWLVRRSKAPDRLVSAAWQAIRSFKSSAAEPYRRVLSFSNARDVIRGRSGGKSSRNVPMAGGVRLRMAFNTKSSPPAKGCLLVSISYSTTPSDQISLR